MFQPSQLSDSMGLWNPKWSDSAGWTCRWPAPAVRPRWRSPAKEVILWWFPQRGVPPNGWFISWKIPLKIDDQVYGSRGASYFRKPHIYIYIGTSSINGWSFGLLPFQEASIFKSRVRHHMYRKKECESTAAVPANWPLLHRSGATGKINKGKRLLCRVYLVLSSKRIAQFQN